MLCSYNPSFLCTDDMEIAPDFFDYFEAAAALLDKDKYVFRMNSKSYTFLTCIYI